MATLLEPAQTTRRATGAWIGLVAAIALMVLGATVPPLLGWEVHTHRSAQGGFAPLHARWEVKVGVGTVPAVALAWLSWRSASDLATRLSWRRLLVVTYAGGLAWLLALALVDGSSGLTRALGNAYEYLPTARGIDDVAALLREYTDRIPYSAADNWPTHVAGHPPGALLFFVLLDRVGLAGDLSAGLVVTGLAATTAPAVLVTLRALGAEPAARHAAPFLVLGPAAVWTAVSADAVFAAVGGWGLALLALASTRGSRGVRLGWATAAGVLLGSCLMLSYGLVLLVFPALAVLAAARTWRPVPVAAGAAVLVVGGFALAGFRMWDAYPVLRERYWDGIAAVRPAAYWLWGDLAALCYGAGPLLGAGLGQLAALRREAGRTVALLVGGAACSVLAADLSLMSKAEVERIWLPFVPWLLVATALLPERWRRPGLALQLVVALVIQHVLYTSW
jgi:methylthioxylose transferase